MALTRMHESKISGDPESNGLIRGDCLWCGRSDIAVDFSTRSCMNCGGYVAPAVQSQVKNVPHTIVSLEKTDYWNDLLNRIERAKPGQVILVDEEISVTGCESQASSTRLANILRFCRVKGVTLKHVRPNDDTWFARQLGAWDTSMGVKRDGSFTGEETAIMKSISDNFMKQVEIIMTLYGDNQDLVGVLAPDLRSKRNEFKSKTSWMLAETRPDMTQEQKQFVSSMAMDEYDHSISEFYNTQEAEEEFNREVAERSEEKAVTMWDKATKKLSGELVRGPEPKMAYDGGTFLSSADAISDLQNAVDICRSEAGISDFQNYALYNLGFIGLSLFAIFVSFYGVAAGGSAALWAFVVLLGLVAMGIRVKGKEAFSN